MTQFYFGYKLQISVLSRHNMLFVPGLQINVLYIAVLLVYLISRLRGMVVHPTNPPIIPWIFYFSMGHKIVIYFFVYNRARQKRATRFLIGATRFSPAGCPMGNLIFLGVVKACRYSILRLIVFTSEDGYSLWITAVPGVYNPGCLHHRDPHACATRYLMSWHPWDFKNIKTPGSSAGEFCRAEYGIVAMRNSTHFDLFSSEDRYIFCERCHSDSTSPSDERWHSQQHWAPAGRTTDVTDRMWPASTRE